MPASDSITSVEYREIEGNPYYRFGSDGSAWSRKSRNGRGSKLTNAWRLLDPVIDKNGYKMSVLKMGLKKRSRYIHSLVLEAFSGPRPPGMQCRHLNGIRTDNRIENLAWGSAKENGQDKVRHGTASQGESHWHAKLTVGQVDEIRALAASGLSWSKLASRYSVVEGTIGHIVHGRSWRGLSLKGS